MLITMIIIKSIRITDISQIHYIINWINHYNTNIFFFEAALCIKTSIEQDSGQEPGRTTPFLLLKQRFYVRSLNHFEAIFNQIWQVDTRHI